MTFREALREPISLQALICLCAGVWIGIAACVVPAALFGAFGPDIKCKVVESAP